MKKWFLWTLPVLLLAQQPAGAVPIHYVANLIPLSGAAEPMGFGNFTFNRDPDPTKNSFSYDIIFDQQADLSVAANAQAGTFSKILPSSITSMYILFPNSDAAFQIFQLNPTGLHQKVTGYSTQDGNGQTFTSLTGGTVVPPGAGGIVMGTLVSSGCATGDTECLDFLSNGLPQSPPYDKACASIPGTTICGLVTAPAPGSLPLFGIGIAGLYLLHQRRKPGQPILPAVAV